MIESPAANDYARAAELRQRAFEFLDECLARTPAQRDSHLIVALQEVANQLGRIEAHLAKTAESAPDAQPAPVLTNVTPFARSDNGIHVSSDAAIVLGLADVSVALAASEIDEAERWLRILREHGNVGRALQRLGMAERQLSTPSAGQRRSPGEPNPVELVAARAEQFASRRRARAVATVDLLFALMALYGPAFDRALYAATSSTRDALLATLADSNQPRRMFASSPHTPAA